LTKALGPFDDEVVLPESLQHRPDMLEMLAPRVAEEQDVIEEDEHKDTDEVLKGVIHDHLECRRRVGEAEGHH
jgi:hypothetical protein